MPINQRFLSILAFIDILQSVFFWGKIGGKNYKLRKLAPMPKLILPLTDSKINKSKPKDKPYKLFDGGGLYIEVYPTGSKLWRIQYSYLKKEKRLSLGQYPVITLAKAREKREEIKYLLADNIDPSTHKKSEDNFITLSMLTAEWIDIKKHRWSEASYIRANSLIKNHIDPTIGKYHIAKITRPMVIDVIKKIETQHAEIIIYCSKLRILVWHVVTVIFF